VSIFLRFVRRLALLSLAACAPLALSTTALIFLKSSGTYHYDASQTPPYQMGPPGGQTVTVS